MLINHAGYLSDDNFVFYRFFFTMLTSRRLFTNRRRNFTEYDLLRFTIIWRMTASLWSNLVWKTLEFLKCVDVKAFVMLKVMTNYLYDCILMVSPFTSDSQVNLRRFEIASGVRGGPTRGGNVTAHQMFSLQIICMIEVNVCF